MEAPDFVKEQWLNGNKNAMGDLFAKVNFQQEIESKTCPNPYMLISISLCSFQYIYEIYKVQFPYLFKMAARHLKKASPYKAIDLLQDVFVNQLTILVKKRQMVEINVEGGMVLGTGNSSKT